MDTVHPRGAGPMVLVVVLVPALVAAGVAISLAPGGEPAAAPVLSDQLRDHLVVLEQRLERLEARPDPRDTPIRAVVPPAEDTGAAASDAAEEAVKAAMNGLNRQLTQLERRLGAVEAGAARASGVDPVLQQLAAARRQQSAEEIAREIDASQGVIVNGAATEADKLNAWRQLRRHKGRWNDAVIAEMVRLGLSSPDAKVRADVWRQADARSTHDALVPALLQALQTDTADDVREEAAETLEIYAGDPAVLQALEYARLHDTSEGVRRFAARSLERAKR